MCRRAWLFVMLLTVIFPGTAKSDDELSGLIDSARFIGVVHIYEGSESPRRVGNGCGVRYTAFELQSIKGSFDGEEISFRAKAALTIAGTYLVFLTDKTEPEADGSSMISGIRAEECLQSGVVLTAMTVPKYEGSSFGPDAILEQRRHPIDNFENFSPEKIRLHAKSDRYFFASESFYDLLGDSDELLQTDLDPIPAHVELSDFVIQGVALKADSLLEYIDSRL